MYWVGGFWWLIDDFSRIVSSPSRAFGTVNHCLSAFIATGVASILTMLVRPPSTKCRIVTWISPSPSSPCGSALACPSRDRAARPPQLRALRGARPLPHKCPAAS